MVENCPKCKSPLEAGPSLKGKFSDGTILQSADFGGRECTNPNCDFHVGPNSLKYLEEKGWIS